MVTITETIASISAYPIPQSAIEQIAGARGLDAHSFYSPNVADTMEYRLAKADLYEWLAIAPDITVGGQSYSFSDTQREAFIAKANALRIENGEKPSNGTRFGYKGSRL